MPSIVRTDCRLCHSKNIERTLPLASTPLGDHYLTKDQLHISEATYPVNMYLCNDCGLTQLVDVLDSEEVYTDYIYKTSDSLGLVEHFKGSVATIFDVIKPIDQSLVIDLGSNDGSYLNIFKSKGMRVLGVEPAEMIAKEADASGIPTLCAFFDEKLSQSIIETHGKALLVTANNMFANIDELHGFVRGVKNLLTEDGVFIFETGYVLDLIQKNIYDNIYHEHLSYFSVKPLVEFFKHMGMSLFRVDRIAPKGGSIRCYVQFESGQRPQSDTIEQLILLEKQAGIQTPEAMHQFAKRLTLLNQSIQHTLSDLKQKGLSVAAYGASVGVTTALYNFNLDKDSILFLADDNVRRQGLYSPGKHVPVLSPRELIDQKVSHTLILAWMYNKQIIDRNKDYLNSGGKFITILPEMKVISG